ncbi:MAG: hypothetical protein NTU97_02495 [Candidatus Magasanikbacteria bacterium]|nr:hypothetical protein [Candidatus Magasanikbacteria bacterium]
MKKLSWLVLIAMAFAALGLGIILGNGAAMLNMALRGVKVNETAGIAIPGLLIGGGIGLAFGLLISMGAAFLAKWTQILFGRGGPYPTWWGCFKKGAPLVCLITTSAGSTIGGLICIFFF